MDDDAATDRAVGARGSRFGGAGYLSALRLSHRPAADQTPERPQPLPVEILKKSLRLVRTGTSLIRRSSRHYTSGVENVEDFGPNQVSLSSERRDTILLSREETSRFGVPLDWNTARRNRRTLHRRIHEQAGRTAAHRVTKVLSQLMIQSNRNVDRFHLSLAKYRLRTEPLARTGSAGLQRRRPIGQSFVAPTLRRRCECPQRVCHAAQVHPISQVKRLHSELHTQIALAGSCTAEFFEQRGVQHGIARPAKGVAAQLRRSAERRGTEEIAPVFGASEGAVEELLGAFGYNWRQWQSPGSAGRVITPSRL